MTLGQFSETVRRIQFDAVADYLSTDQTVWAVWVFDIWRYRNSTTGHLWWRKNRTGRNLELSVEMFGRHRVHYDRHDLELVFHLPHDMAELTVDFDGIIKGIRIYRHCADSEPVALCEFQGNTNKVYAGSVIRITNMTLKVP